MRVQSRPPLEPRKTRIQMRSAVTVDTISEATIQVLPSVGPDHLTTTRVAERADPLKMLAFRISTSVETL